MICLIIALAARYKLPAIYIARFFADASGLIPYGPNLVDAIGARLAILSLVVISLMLPAFWAVAN